eukprot:g6067.t1
MAPKKAKAKKKSTGDKGDEKVAAKGESSLVAEPPLAMPSDEEWVTLELKLLNWKFLDFKHRARTTTHIFTVKNLLLEHHGRVDDLILCKGSFTEANELKDEMQTLKGYGIKGAPRGVDPPVTVPLFYDFKPVAYDEPLLLVWNRSDGNSCGVLARQVYEGSIASELRESIEEIEEEDAPRSDYSLEFDDDLDSPWLGQRGNGQAGGSRARDSIGEVGAAGDSANKRREQEGGRKSGGLLASAVTEDDSIPELYASSAFELESNRSGAVAQAADGHYQESRPIPPTPPRGAFTTTAEENAPTGVKAAKDDDTQHREGLLPVQVVQLKSRLDGLLRHGDSHTTTATEAIMAVTREHAALRDCLGDVERELLKARRKVTDDAAARLRAAREKRARAEARRVRHFEQLGEARRVATVAKAEAEAVRAQLADRESELRHVRDMLDTARSAASTAEERADRCQIEASAAEARLKDISEELTEVRERTEQENRRAVAAARDAQDKIELCERKRELEVSAAIREAEAREKAAEEQLKRLPEHQQQLVQAELDRVTRWEERLVAEAASLRHKEEAHKIDMEAWRAQAARAEAESRTRAKEEVSREQASLKEARSALDAVRGELLRRMARSEAAAQAATAEATAARAEADEARRRLEAEQGAMEIRAAMLAPELRAVENGRAALEESQREAREEARRAKEKACRALEMEEQVVQREYAVEVKWKELISSRRALKQIEKSMADEADALSEQRKAVALVRVRLHEQQMEMALQMSEIRKALALMKRVDTVEDAPARRMALELGALACDRGEMAAQRVAKLVEPEESSWSGCGGRGDSGCRHGTGGGRGESKPQTGVGDVNRLIPAPCQGQAWNLDGARDAIAPKTSVSAAEDTGAKAEDTRVDATAMRRGGGAYADEAGARETLEKVRSVLASTGDGWQGQSGSGADEGGGGGWGGSVQSWTTKLQAAAVATGAFRSF